jgi:hypothetical protein
MNRFIGTLFAVVILISIPVAVLAESGWQFCANENGFCNFRGEAEVRYGAEGRYVQKRLSNGIDCRNGIFGDPAPGLPKNCFYKEVRHRDRDRDRRHWEFCANEDGFCNFRGEAEVRYGAEGRYVYKRFSNGIDCRNGIFGDPAPGLPKNCYIAY